jgi:hypothetical protein
VIEQGVIVCLAACRESPRIAAPEFSKECDRLTDAVLEEGPCYIDSPIRSDTQLVGMEPRMFGYIPISFAICVHHNIS